MVEIVLTTVIISILTVYFTDHHTLIHYSINLLLHTIFFLIYPWISILFFYYISYVVYEERENLIMRIQLMSSIFIVYLYIQSKEIVSDYLTRLPNRVAFKGLIKYRLKSRNSLKRLSQV